MYAYNVIIIGKKVNMLIEQSLKLITSHRIHRDRDFIFELFSNILDYSEIVEVYLRRKLALYVLYGSSLGSYCRLL